MWELYVHESSVTGYGMLRGMQGNIKLNLHFRLDFGY